MNTNIFSSGSSVLSNDALASSWKEFQETHFSGSARSSFRIWENYEIIPDESLPMAALYWKRKYLDLSVQDEERQGRYADLLRSYEQRRRGIHWPDLGGEDAQPPEISHS